MNEESKEINNEIVKQAVKNGYIKEYQSSDFNKWLYHTIDEILYKSTVKQLVEMFYDDCTGEGTGEGIDRPFAGDIHKR